MSNLKGTTAIFLAIRVQLKKKRAESNPSALGPRGTRPPTRRRARVSGCDPLRPDNLRAYATRLKRFVERQFCVQSSSIAARPDRVHCGRAPLARYSVVSIRIGLSMKIAVVLLTLDGAGGCRLHRLRPSI